jgi:hypothetical protein
LIDLASLLFAGALTWVMPGAAGRQTHIIVRSGKIRAKHLGQDSQ